MDFMFGVKVPPGHYFKKGERGQSCNYDSVWILNMGLNLFLLTVPGRG